jgi:hypothetical protein
MMCSSRHDVKHDSDEQLRLALLERYFLNRTDFVAFQWGANPCRLEPEGNLPAVLRSHVTGERGPRARAFTQKNPKGRPVSGPYRVGSYCPDLDAKVRWACFDADGGDRHSNPLADARCALLTVYERLRSVGLPSYPEMSGGGSGWHDWLFFSEPVDAALVRRLLFALFPTGIPLRNGGFASARTGAGVELFPKSDGLRGPAKAGNQVFLPFWHGAEFPRNEFHRVTANGLEPYQPTGFQSISLATLERLAADLGVREEPKPRTDRPASAGSIFDNLRATTGGGAGGYDVPRAVNDALALAGRKSRHDACLWLTCQLRDNRVGECTARAAVLDYASRVHQTGHPYTPCEAMRVFDSAFFDAPRPPSRGASRGRESGKVSNEEEEDDTQEKEASSEASEGRKEGGCDLQKILCQIGLPKPPSALSCPWAATARAKGSAKKLLREKKPRKDGSVGAGAFNPSCRRARCVVCFQILRWNKTVAAAERFLDLGEPLYVSTVANKRGWNARREQIRCREAPYLRIATGDGTSVVFTPATIDGLKPFPPDDAVAELVRVVMTLTCRPLRKGSALFAWSRGWTPKKKPSTHAYVGDTRASAARIAALARDLGLKHAVRDDGPGHGEGVNLVYPADWTEEDIKRVEREIVNLDADRPPTEADGDGETWGEHTPNAKAGPKKGVFDLTVPRSRKRPEPVFTTPGGEGPVAF